MHMEAKKFQTFEDLEAYKAAREFRIAMYAVTRKLPSFEKFEVASQMRRAALSLTSNIAEGHGRYHFLDQIRFMLNARGSAQELLDDLNACGDENYVPVAEVHRLKSQGWNVLRLLNGYIRWLRDRKLGHELELKEHSVAYNTGSDAELDAWLATLDFEPVKENVREAHVTL